MLITAAALVGLLGVLILLGSLGGGGSDDDNANTSTHRTTPPRQPTTPRPSVPPPTPRPRTVRLALVPTDAVYVCLVDAGGKRLIDGEVLQRGESTTTYRSRRFRLFFGHGGQTMRVNGRTVSVPATSDPIGYEITPRARRVLTQARLPTCSQ